MVGWGTTSPQHGFARGTGTPHLSVKLKSTPLARQTRRVLFSCSTVGELSTHGCLGSRCKEQKAGRRCAILSCPFGGSSLGPALTPSHPLPLCKLPQFPSSLVMEHTAVRCCPPSTRSQGIWIPLFHLSRDLYPILGASRAGYCNPTSPNLPLTPGNKAASI